MKKRAATAAEEVQHFEAAQALCKRFGAHIAMMFLVRGGEMSWCCAGQSAHRDYIPPEYLTPLLALCREAMSVLEDKLSEACERTSAIKGDGWQYFTRAIAVAPVTSGRVRTVGGHDLARIWFEHALAGELILPRGQGELMMMALGLKRTARDGEEVTDAKRKD